MQIDSDNQCDPRDFVKFYKKIKNKKSDFVFGYRKKRGDGYLRVIISRFMSFIFYLKKKIYIKDLNTPYRVMNTEKLRNILENINDKKSNNIKLFNCLYVL
jgi:dolichol-phosphate mannosyltransferase